MVTASERLAFVLQNFLLVYQSPTGAAIEINYDRSSENGISVPDLSAGYFNSAIHFEAIPMQWIKYKDEHIPLLFADKYCQVPYESANSASGFAFDIISAIFFFLSGWQETVVESDDKLGRFTFRQSIQKELNISTLPVVHYYFMMLRDAIEQTYSIILTNKINQEHKFNAIVSHDVDYWVTLWRKELKYAVKNKDVGKILQLLINRLLPQCYIACFDRIYSLQKKYGFKSTFFFLPDTEKYLGNESADYAILALKHRKFIQQLAKSNEIGLHGSFNSSILNEKLKLDLTAINAVCLADINRFHFLMFAIKSTPKLLEDNHIKIDSTLGFNDMPGFRYGTAYPFYLFDYERNIASRVIEIPLVVMDASLFYGHYLGCKSKVEAWQYILPILHQFDKSGGNLVVNWHNDAFAALGRQVWVETFEDILAYCTKKGALFVPMKTVIKQAVV